MRTAPGRSSLVPARAHLEAFEVPAGAVLRVSDVAGQQAADIAIAPLDEPKDWLSCIYTQLLNRTARISTGHILYSKLARPLATVVEDTAGVHWFGGGCCSAETNAFRYGEADSGSCRQNLLASLGPRVEGPLDLELDSIASLFMNISVAADGALAIVEPPSRAGDYIEFRAERDLLVAVSACPQDSNPCNGFDPTPVQLTVR